MTKLKESFDYTLITSANAFAQRRHFPESRLTILIGKSTEERCPKSIQPRYVLDESNSQGIIRFFRKNATKGQNVFFPRSKLGDSDLVRSLRRMSLRVTVRHAYTLREHTRFATRMRSIARRKGLKIVLLSSPSSFYFLKRRLGLRALRGSDIRLCAIGPTTRRAVLGYGLECFQSTKPDLRALILKGSSLR